MIYTRHYMNNKEYISELAQSTGYTFNTTKNIVRSVVDAMAKQLEEGNSIFIAGYGTFEVKKRLERIVTNPTTLQKMLVPPKLILNFKPVTAFKEKINNGNDDE